MSNKIVVYQVLPRLFGNKNYNRNYNGTIEENGCGKFNDFTEDILLKIKQLSITHIWYTGVIRHATKTNYTQYGIPTQNKDVIKGEAGSPYAITDYYDVSPNLSDEIDNRLEEFKLLIERTHKVGLKVIIDFVPNHVAREYKSIKVSDLQNLGSNDENSQAFSINNNFYYLPNQSLQLNFKENHYNEFPAKATGNDCFHNAPCINDWYDTVKLNYGIDYNKGEKIYLKTQKVPDTWTKMCDILLYWSNFGVDGFRCDMAEMVPIDFWSYAIKKVKSKYKDIIFIAEVYNKYTYGEYIDAGFNFLYDKVGMYECMKNIICHNFPTQSITQQWQETDKINDNLLYFLENHDEQRIASDFFCGNAIVSKPAFAVMCFLRKNPIMIYFGQEVGEKGMDKEGYSGIDGRTSIFDYWSIDTIIRSYYTNKLTEEELCLNAFYRDTLHIATRQKAITHGLFFDLMYVNNHISHKQYAFIRKNNNECMFIIANFSSINENIKVNIPQHAFDYLQLKQEKIKAKELYSNSEQVFLLSANQPIDITIKAHSVLAYIFLH